MAAKFQADTLPSVTMQTSRASDSNSAQLPYGGRLMFTQSWEDPDCDLAALRPQPGETILAVISGGDNLLGLLLSDPAEVVAVDLNPTQLYLLELKRAAFRRLAHAEMLILLGVRTGMPPQRLYQKLRPDLSPAALAFWDGRTGWFDQGLLLRGGFERYYAMCRAMLRIVIGGRRLERLFTLPAAAQRDFYHKEWDTWRWRALLRIACSKYVLGKRLDPAWFAHAEISSFGAHFSRLAEHAVAELPARSNYFLAQIFLGRYLDENTVPEYLRAENFETIRGRLDRITPVMADIGAAVSALAPQSVNCFALSNVFEYSPPVLFEQTLSALVRAARPGARFALRNLLAPRRLADHAEFSVDVPLSTRLRDADRGFIYSRFEAAILAEPALQAGIRGVA
jgi:S-adenosylmethionine-diacylglycerol 3-amino-3-carboxypropyl transferase